MEFVLAGGLSILATRVSILPRSSRWLDGPFVVVAAVMSYENRVLSHTLIFDKNDYSISC